MNQLMQPSRASDGGAPVQDRQSYLTFMLGAEMFAIGILAVKEIIEYETITTVPMMPQCITGVINVRGAVVPVMDLSLRFGRAASVCGKRSCIVIVETASTDGPATIGMLVDAVNAVLDIPDSDIEAPPSFGARVRSEFIQGMGKVGGKFVLIIKAQEVLSENDIGNIALATGLADGAAHQGLATAALALDG
ncbi:MAG: chemotaxis protein CheW [Pseudomonadota bacterium]